jgi:hypothetical protein
MVKKDKEKIVFLLFSGWKVLPRKPHCETRYYPPYSGYFAPSGYPLCLAYAMEKNNIKVNECHYE